MGIGFSYAYWCFTFTQDDFNVIDVHCFEVTLTEEENSIHLENVTPIPDEEGQQLTPYTFTIKNTCDTYAHYQVNLEDINNPNIEKRLSYEYIKASLDGGTPHYLNFYQRVEPTLENADKSFQLTSGTLSPAGTEGDSRSYALRLWLDYDTPAIDETMSAVFESRISVIADYVEEENLTNKITISYESQTEGYSKDSETVEITATSEKYNIIEYSQDGITYHPVNPNKQITLTMTYETERTEKIYVRDEMGNVESIEFPLEHLDQTGPSITATPSSEWGLTNPIQIELNDNKSGLSKYQITTTEEEPTEWKEVTGSAQTITETVTENGSYYIWALDEVGNINHISVTVEKIDTEGPVVAVQTSTGNGTITVNASQTVDTGSGIAQYEYSINGQTYYPSETSSYTFTNVSHGTHTVYVRVTDKLGNQSIKTTNVNVVVTYTITFNANGGSGAPAAQTKTHGTNLTLSSTVPTKSGGWRFLGWSTSSTATSATYSAGGTFNVNANTTLYAVWQRITHTVTYNYSYNGGTSASATTATVGEGDAISLSPKATKSGYTFLGWNTNANATTALSSLKMSTSNVTLYAIYRKTITVTYRDGQGTTSNSVYAYNKATSASIKLATPRTYQDNCGGSTWNYVWTTLGWSTGTTANGSINYSSGQTITVSSNMTLYGQYRKVVRIVYNGGATNASCTRRYSADHYIYYNGNGSKTSVDINLDMDFTCTRTDREWNRSVRCDGQSLKIRDYASWEFFDLQCAMICDAEWK